MCFMGVKTFNPYNEITHFCLHTQSSKQVLVTSQFLHAYNIDNYNPYKITYKYIQENFCCLNKSVRHLKIT